MSDSRPLCRPQLPGRFCHVGPEEVFSDTEVDRVTTPLSACGPAPGKVTSLPTASSVFLKSQLVPLFKALTLDETPHSSRPGPSPVKRGAKELNPEVPGTFSSCQHPGCALTMRSSPNELRGTKRPK